MERAFFQPGKIFRLGGPGPAFSDAVRPMAMSSLRRESGDGGNPPYGDGLAQALDLLPSPGRRIIPETRRKGKLKLETGREKWYD